MYIEYVNKSVNSPLNVFLERDSQPSSEMALTEVLAVSRSVSFSRHFVHLVVFLVVCVFLFVSDMQTILTRYNYT